MAYMKRERTMSVLARAGIIGPGTEIVVHSGHLDGIWPRGLGANGRRATIGPRLSARDNIVWTLDGEAYPLTALRDRLIDAGAPFTRGKTYEHWALASEPEKSLWQLAEEVGR